MKPTSRPPTPISPAGTSVSGPIWGTVQIAALSGELSPDELALLTGIIQQPAELSNGARALDDYISILQTQATAGTAASEADLLAFAKQLKEHKGYGGKDGTERT